MAGWILNRELFSGTNGYIFFGFLSFFLFLNLYFTNNLVITDDIYYQTYGEQVAMEHIKGIIEMVKRWQWIGYILVPLILFIKINFTALCLNIGTIFSGYKTGYREIFKIALIAELVFIIGKLVKTVFLFFITDVHTLADIQYFAPLSLMNFFDTYSIPSWSVYPFTTLSVFELLYWLVLARGIQFVLNRQYAESFSLVLGSYGTGLLVWMVFVVFLSINIS